MPATGNFILDKGYDASAAITAYRAVKFTAEETVGPVTAVTDQIAGVAQFGVTAGEITKGKGASVRVEGATEMEVSAALTVGQAVSIASDGRAKPAATGERIIGICRSGADTAGKRASVHLTVGGHLSP